MGLFERLAWAGIAAGITALVPIYAVSGDEPAKAPVPMKMDQPMAGEMKKEGMTKGDVRKAAAKKQRDMKDAMEKEEKAMPEKSLRK